MPTWLYDYLHGTTNTVSYLQSYYTQTPCEDSSYKIYAVSAKGNLLNLDLVASNGSGGIRPVITIPKSQLG